MTGYRQAVGSWLAVAAAAAALGGCTPADERELVPVSGRVRRNGGGWPQPGSLSLMPVAADAAEAAAAGPRATRPAFAEFDVEGAFTLTTRRPGDGAMPGRYRVGISCWRVQPEGEAQGVDAAAPEAVGNPLTSTLIVDIPRGGTRELVIDVRD